MLSFAPDQRTGLFVESMRAFKSFPLPIAAVTSVESPRCCSFLLGKRLNGLARISPRLFPPGYARRRGQSAAFSLVFCMLSLILSAWEQGLGSPRPGAPCSPSRTALCSDEIIATTSGAREPSAEGEELR